MALRNSRGRMAAPALASSRATAAMMAGPRHQKLAAGGRLADGMARRARRNGKARVQHLLGP